MGSNVAGMFPYFGRKGKLAPYYPSPTFDTVIEPFAGSMSWTLRHRPISALGIERDERVVDLWHRVCAMTEDEILAWPKPNRYDKTNDLLVMLCSYSEHSLTSDELTVTQRMLRDWDSVLRNLAESSKWARSFVDYRQGTYRDAPDVEATWFIDPPYQRANRRGYRYRDVDFIDLRDFVMSRRGQVIVCEQEGADWLPFRPLADIVSHRGVKKSEVVWLGEWR